MTKPGRRSVLGIAALAGVLTCVRIAAWPIVRVSLPPRAEIVMTAESTIPPVPPESLVALVIGRNPFRLTRRPALVPYDAVRAAQPPSPPTPRPTLSLAGIVWDGGANPSAVVDGLPGIEGPRVVRKGEIVGAISVRSITSDRVVMVGHDTIWTLTVKEPWR
jgi:hypothetical protein